jgi:hypothetical protein
MFQLRLPGFKATCLTISGLYVLLCGSLFAKGLAVSMAEYKIPAVTLASPHYLDSLHWVYTHMLVIGLIIGFVGWYAREAPFKRAFSRLMLAAHVYYTYLDFIHSDSVVGNALYKGPTSIIPAYFALFFTGLFLYLSLGGHAKP